jgi:hypothetical protein
MMVRVHVDEPLCCDEELILRVEGVMEGELERFSTQLSGVEVHLRDLNSSVIGDRDKCCHVEAHVTGTEPVVATCDGLTLAEAIHDAAAKLRRTLAQFIRETEAAAVEPLVHRDVPVARFRGAGAAGVVADSI